MRPDRPVARMNGADDVWIGLDDAHGVIVGLEDGRVVPRFDSEAELVAAGLGGNIERWVEIHDLVTGLVLAAEQGYIATAEELCRVARACCGPEAPLGLALTCEDPAVLLVLAHGTAVPDTLGQNPHTPLVGLVELASRARHEQLVAIRSGRLPGDVLARLAGSEDSSADTRSEALDAATGQYSRQKRSVEDASRFLTALAAEPGWWERSELERSAMLRPVTQMLYEVCYWGSSEASALAAGVLARAFQDPTAGAPPRTTGALAVIEAVLPGMTRLRRWSTMNRAMRHYDRVMKHCGRPRSGGRPRRWR